MHFVKNNEKINFYGRKDKGNFWFFILTGWSLTDKNY